MGSDISLMSTVTVSNLNPAKELSLKFLNEGPCCFLGFPVCFFSFKVILSLRVDFRFVYDHSCRMRLKILKVLKSIHILFQDACLDNGHILTPRASQNMSSLALGT